MSASNYNQYGPQNDPSPSQRTEKSKAKTALIVVGVLLGLLSILNGVIYFRGANKMKEMGTALSEKDRMLDSLEIQYNLATKTIDSLRQLFPDKEIIADLQAQLDQKNEIIKQGINRGDSRALAAARKEISDLTEINKKLSDDLTAVKDEKQSLETRIQSLQEELAKSNSELTATKEELERLKNNGKTSGGGGGDEVPIASPPSGPESSSSYLTCSSVTAEAIEESKKNPGRTRPTKSAKKASRVKVCFKVSGNPNVRAGSQEFQVRVIEPAGTTLQSGGSGQGMDVDTRMPFNYSSLANLEYNGASGEGCGEFQPNTDLSKGKYTIEVYHRGHKVGVSTLTLKK